MEETEERTTTEAALAAVFELGAWTGKSQAFDAVRYHSGAARAACLKQIRDNRSFDNFGLTWEAFCDRHLGLAPNYRQVTNSRQ